tara:strand:+ start:241 stop:612 length:372 start_codon:yes stop_codon:yes gene_type:complete
MLHNTQQSQEGTLSSNEMAIVRTLLASQRTYLATIRTAAIFAGLSILIKQKFVLIITMALIMWSIFEYTQGYQLLKKVVSPSASHQNQELVTDGIPNNNNLLYGYSGLLLIILVTLLFMPKDK